VQALLRQNEQLAAATQSLQREHTAWEAAIAALRRSEPDTMPQTAPVAPTPTACGTSDPTLVTPSLGQPSPGLDSEALVGMIAELRRQLRNSQKGERELQRRAGRADRAAAAANAVAEATKVRLQNVGEHSLGAAREQAESVAAAHVEASRLRLRCVELEERASAAERAAERARIRATGSSDRAATLEGELSVTLACLRKWEEASMSEGSKAPGQTASLPKPAPCAACVARLAHTQTRIHTAAQTERAHSPASGSVSQAMADLLEASQHVCAHKKLTSAFRRCVAAAQVAASSDGSACQYAPDNAGAGQRVVSADESVQRLQAARNAVQQLSDALQESASEAHVLRSATVHLHVSLREACEAWQETTRSSSPGSGAVQGGKDVLQVLTMLTQLAKHAAAARGGAGAPAGATALPHGATASACAAANSDRERAAACQRAAASVTAGLQHFEASLTSCLPCAEVGHAAREQLSAAPPAAASFTDAPEPVEPKAVRTTETNRKVAIVAQRS
jgi:hypothetical protein